MPPTVSVLCVGTSLRHPQSALTLRVPQASSECGVVTFRVCFSSAFSIIRRCGSTRAAHGTKPSGKRHQERSRQRPLKARRRVEGVVHLTMKSCLSDCRQLVRSGNLEMGCRTSITFNSYVGHHS
ncbi:hypothetical protein MPTK1_6g11690 [Marchantia polymorpha subsp. ruderalis]|uniref:Uncharacterized protein n=2 Tax=Marchantia polymorpha TaxID=3197 RepID=A0AAF6BR01_MARPO|nr:hypothetical protein MARPO_0016s0208 [Marchantia polymorpha]BBN14435.1 hypothetical protein Mp_6g11690 [Marchantia polymorpha subsp. ruderalis]|eukprot:PTQ45169.1 hypothetical protein MARPO_0016s0208 [Marchantia polymorpha]